MTEGDNTTSILKRDARGRVRSTPAQRQAVLAQFERSGLSGPQFARVAGIAYPTLANWRQRQRKAAAETSAFSPQRGGGVRLMEAVMAPAQHPGLGSGAVLRIDLPGGASMAVADLRQAALAAQFIQALAAASSC